MSYYSDLRVLTEVTMDNETVMDILGRSGVESSVLLIKASIIFARDIKRAKSIKNPEERLKAWKQLLKDARAMRKAANNIPPDGIADHTWRLFTSPWWVNTYAYSAAYVDPDKKVTTVTKDDTIQKFDMMIAYIELEIKRCEERVK